MSEFPLPLPSGLTVLERGWLSANNVILVGADSAAIVDTGYCTHSVQTEALVRGVLGSRSLDLILNTHLHSDHCGGNAMLQNAYPKATTMIPPGQAAHVRNWDPVALTFQPTGQECPMFHFERVLDPGSELELADSVWDIHAAPGHDPHSVVLFDPRTRTLISADAFWENGFGVVFQELEGDRAFAEVGETLDLIEALEPRLVIPGHGPVFIYSDSSMAASRRRLDAFMREPKKHAAHAAKVLLKFKLLDVQQISIGDLHAWVQQTHYFSLIHSRWFAGQSLQDWANEMLASLQHTRAVRRDGNLILNS